MKIILAGGNGFLGRSLVANSGEEIDWVVLCRDKKVSIPRAKVVNWDGKTMGNWATELESADALINLSGKSVNCRYTEKNKAAIFASRLESTGILQTAMEQCKNPPAVWLNSASATIYRHSLDKAMTEETGEIGKGFSVEVCKAWEQFFFKNEITGVRKIALRTAIVIGKEAGVLPYFKNLVRYGLGGKMGSGKQMFSWIHEQDFANAVQYLIHTKTCEGVYNIAAPNPVTNAYFMQTLGKQMAVRIGIPTPAWMLKIGAILLGTETELILKSRWVIPEKLQKTGFKFKYPSIETALKDLN